MAQEAGELEKMREQMQSNKRFDSHYKVLGGNKEAIIYLDGKIDELLNQKMKLIGTYAQASIKASGAIVDGALSPTQKANCDKLKPQIDEQIKFYDSELKSLQRRRASLWDTHTELQEYLLEQEKTRNQSLDFLYKQHSGLLEKVYIRHIDDSENVAKETITAGTSTFKEMVLAPIQFLLQYFNISTGVSLNRVQIENINRDEVEKVEKDVNDPEKKDDDEIKEDGDVKTDDTSEDNSPTNSSDEADKENETRLLSA